MKNTFDFSRYVRYILTDLQCNGRLYLGALGGALGVLLLQAIYSIVIFGVKFTNQTHELEISINFSYYPVLFVLGCLGGSIVFKSLGSKEQAIPFLTLPATQLEKYLAKITIVVPFFFVAYTIGIILIWLVADAIALVKYGQWVEYEPLDTIFNVDSCIPLMIFFALQSFFVLGSSLWPKNSFWKTLGALIVVGVVYSMYCTVCARFILTHNHYNAPPFLDFQGVEYAIVGVLSGVACIVNYTLAYFRLKESEIINHW